MRLSSESASAAANAVLADLSGGSLVILDGQTELVTLRLGSPAFAKANAGIALALPIGPAVAAATGTAGTFQARTAQGRVVFSGTVGLDTRSDLTLQAGIQVGAEVLVDRLEYRQPLQ